MVRMSSLILTIKRSPFVPIEFYRDPPAFAGVSLRSRNTFSCLFSEPSEYSRARRVRARASFLTYSRMIL
jgi:hypothetical protein